MLRKLNWRIAAAAALVLMMTAAASAQRGGRGFGGDSTVGLLRSDAVLTELNASDEQKAEITTILEESRGERPDANLRDLPEEERRKKFAELREQAEKRNAEALAKIEKALKPDQLKRLKQLGMQRRGLSALTDDNVATTLKLSEQQRKEIAAAFQSSREKMRELFQGGNREGIREKLTELRKQSEATVEAVLTAEQKTEFEALKGEAFEFPERGPRRPRPDRENERPQI